MSAQTEVIMDKNLGSDQGIIGTCAPDVPPQDAKQGPFRFLRGERAFFVKLAILPHEGVGMQVCDVEQLIAR
jgi:hypothetical protein